MECIYFLMNFYEICAEYEMNYQAYLVSLLRWLNPEHAHRLTILGLKLGFVQESKLASDPILRNKVWGLSFKNPLGLAAGFDKNAEVPFEMLRQGLSFVEVGSVTPQPQYGNEKPRIFRLYDDHAIINCLGFNNKGSAFVAKKLVNKKKKQGEIIGINFGKNKDSEDEIGDYRDGVKALAQYADYIVINVSSPNTKGLRSLQKPKKLAKLVTAVQLSLKQLGLKRKLPLLLKISPDLKDDEKRDIAKVILDLGIDGLIATNTTTLRPAHLNDQYKLRDGGLSGQPLFDISTQVMADFYRLTDGKVPLIGVGGVSTGTQAYKKIRSGASLIQLYSALIYSGPRLIDNINFELAELLRRDGFQSIREAVGVDVV